MQRGQDALRVDTRAMKKEPPYIAQASKYLRQLSHAKASMAAIEDRLLALGWQYDSELGAWTHPDHPEIRFER